MPNAWIEFVKRNKGSGKSLQQLAREYKPMKETRTEIKRRGTCAKEVAEVASLKRQLATKKRQLASALAL